MTKELENLLNNFNKKLEAAQDAHAEVEAYLLDKYGIDYRNEYESLEDSCNWCYGFDRRKMEMLIAERNE